MFKQDSNKALLDKVESFCMYIEHGNNRISVVVLTKEYAATALHCVPEPSKQLGLSVILHDACQKQHSAKIHGLNKISDYVVFKKSDGFFNNVPEMAVPRTLDKYISVGFAFDDKTSSVRVGHVSSVSSGSKGFFYGDSGGLPGFSGGGVFYSRNGALLGIARGSDWVENETKQYGDVLEIISAQIIASHIEVFHDQPFSI